MPEVQIYPYEGMFLFPQAATANLQDAVDHIKDILTRAEAEIISLKKWDERRLAYDVKGNKRGVYFLVYFRARGSQLANIERDCNYSEKLLRAMIVRADHVTDEVMQAADGQQQLADEIKLRAQAPAGGASAPAPAPASQPVAAASQE
jgi:small subunit ribosomal protein S6